MIVMKIGHIKQDLFLPYSLIVLTVFVERCCLFWCFKEMERGEFVIRVHPLSTNASSFGLCDQETSMFLDHTELW